MGGGLTIGLVWVGRGNVVRAWACEARRIGSRGGGGRRDEGAVGAMAAGDPAALDAFADWLHRGPPLARVAGVSTESLATDPPEVAFRVI